MSGSAPPNALCGVSTIGLLIKACPLLFPVCMLIVELLMLFPSVAFFRVLFVSVDPSPLVSDDPPVFASEVDPLPLIIVADHLISNSERKIHGFFLGQDYPVW